jgi:DNA-binding response OmpR family regulator
VDNAASLQNAQPPAKKMHAGKKVMFADFAVVKYSSLIQWLRQDEMITDAVTDPARFQSRISEEWYDACIVNLLLGGIGPFELIKNVRSTSKNPSIKIIVISKQLQRMNIQNTMRAGANDFVADPVDPENLYNRILYHLSPKKEIDSSGLEQTTASKEAWPFLEALLRASETLSRAELGKEHENFLKVLTDVAKLVQSNRTSLMIVDEESSSGVVLATSDDPGFHDFPISLHKYPEVLHVMHSGVFVLIDDVSKNALTQSISNTVQSISIGSIMVFPVRFGADVVGTLTIRRPKATEVPPMDVLRILQALANTLASHAYFRARLRRIYKEYAKGKPAAPSPSGEGSTSDVSASGLAQAQTQTAATEGGSDSGTLLQSDAPIDPVSAQILAAAAPAPEELDRMLAQDSSSMSDVEDNHGPSTDTKKL